MACTLRFLGATGTVTGSRTLLEVGERRILIDCGLYQGRGLQDRNWESLPVSPKSIDAVLLTHAHLDHCGYLPRLVKQGFSGPVITTSASAEIARIILLDSAHMQEEDARYKMKRHRKEGRTDKKDIQPLYTKEDAEAVFPLFKPTKYDTAVQVVPGVTATFYDAGHILGSAMIRLEITDEGKTRTLLLSGDIGRDGKPILRDPTHFAEADAVVIESTYGDRDHPAEEDVESLLADAVLSTLDRGGNLLIPCFAVERSQEILYHLRRLRDTKRIPTTMTFLDSPMAVSVTQVFTEHPEMFDKEMAAMVKSGHSPFDIGGLKLVRTPETSKSINRIRGSAIILAGSGMCTGGRIKHHLAHNLHRPESMVLFVGFQAIGTLGRQILESGGDEVRIFGRLHKVRAQIRRIHGFSGHADRTEMLAWLGHLKRPPQQVFVIHGEHNVSDRFAETIRKDLGWNAVAPSYSESIPLFPEE